MSKKKLLIFENEDKTFQETADAENLLYIPHSFRCILCGPPSSGKSSVLKNIIINQKKPFDVIYLFHIDHSTDEYQDIDVVVLDELPEIEDIDPKKKNLIIIEDIDVKSLNKKQKSLLDRYFGYVSTHKNTSIAITCQQPYSIPPSLRRLSNVMCLWRGNDLRAMGYLSQSFGYDYKYLSQLFNVYCKTKHDFITFTDHNPKIRKNMTLVI